MPRVLSAKQIWQSWTATTVEGDLARRREAVLLETLATLVVLGIVAQLVQLLTFAIGPRNSHAWLWIPAMTLTTLGFYGLLQLARGGQHRTSATCLVVLLSVLSFGLLAEDGVDHSVWPLLSATTVLIAALLLGRQAGASVTGTHAVALFVTAAVEVTAPDGWFSDSQEPSIGNAAAPVLLLLLITRSCWLYTREIVTGIDEVLTHGSEASPLRQLRTKSLSIREVEVVQLVSEGLTNEAIAKRLFVSPRTVQSHIANAMGKSGATNRTELGVLAIREGLVPLEAPDLVNVSAADGTPLSH